MAAVLVALAVVNAVYLFHGSLTALGDYQFAAPALRGVQDVLPAWLPVPLPTEYLLGFDTQIDETGYEAYLLGTFNTTGFWNYFLVGFLVKTPEPLMLTALAALALRPRISLREIPMLVVCGLLFVFFSAAGHKNVGIRYLLFILPVA